ncbi:MAG: hypothetical protein AAF514_18160 [Verrucomicrobiota bacterium]
MIVVLSHWGLHLCLNAEVIADSQADWSWDGIQGERGWHYGYRNVTNDGGAKDYDPKVSFIPFRNDGTLELSDRNHWNGSLYSLSPELFSEPPWTYLTAEESHTNGVSSSPHEEHWPIRRFVAENIDRIMPIAIRWTTGSGPPYRASGGHTTMLYINGKRVDEVTLGPEAGAWSDRTYYHNLLPGDIIDLASSPLGTDGALSDSGDAIRDALYIDTDVAGDAQQPDGSPFEPLQDEDQDGLPDIWELQFSPGNLAALKKDGDADGDGITDFEEFLAGTNPIEQRQLVRLSVRTEGSQIVVSWPSGRNIVYQIYRSSTLKDWDPGNVPIELRENEAVVILPLNEGKVGFFRVRTE